MHWSRLNTLSQPVLGYDVVVRDERDQVLILPVAKYSFAVLCSFVCLLIYFASSIFFSIFSKTYKYIPIDLIRSNRSIIFNCLKGSATA